MTAVAEDLDLGWVTFATDHADQPCDGMELPCNREAVAVAVIKAACGHLRDRVRLCAGHRDAVVSGVAAGRQLICNVCPAPVELVRVEPIR
jgi:hypothetical protein